MLISDELSSGFGQWFLKCSGKMNCFKESVEGGSNLNPTKLSKIIKHAKKNSKFEENSIVQLEKKKSRLTLGNLKFDFKYPIISMPHWSESILVLIQSTKVDRY